MGEEFILNIIAALNKQLSKKQLRDDLNGMNDSMYVRVIAKLTTALSKQQLKKDLKKLNDLYVQIGANVRVDKDTKTQLQNRIQELQKSLSELKVNLKVSKSKAVGEVDSVRKELQAKAGKVPVGFDIEIKRNKAIADIEYLGKRFSKLFTNVAAKQKYENILMSAYSISDESQLRSVRNQIAAFTSELKANGLASQSLGDKWRGLIERAKNLFSAASIVTTIFTQAKQAVSTFLQLDTAMTNLYKVTDDITGRDQFSGLLTKWNKLAQNLAVTTQSLIDATAEWSKIGFGLDMSEQLAQVTAIFEKTAEISTEKASSTLISAAQAFTEIGNLGEDDYVARVEAIGDRINAVGNQYSISSEGIADGLQNASAALKLAGNDLDETIALITAANKIFQSPSEVSNMLKVASMRLRGQVDALEEMGEDATGVSADITKIQQQIYELTGNKVNIFEDEDTLKSTYQMILEIGEVFDSLNDRSQADLLEVMFGKQRASAGASLLLNYEELEKIKNDSMNAANSMAEEYSKYMESAEAHITIFREKLVETYSTLMDTDMISHAADMGTALLDLVNSTDLLRHSILAVLALNIGNGITAVGAAIANTSKQMNALGSALQQVKDLPLDKALRKESLQEVGEATKNLTEKNLNLLLSQKQLGDSDRIRILRAQDLSKKEAQLKLEKMGLTTATNTQSAANITEAATTTTLKGAMTSLKASIIGVGTSIKAAFMSNPIGFVITGIVTAVSLATTAMSKYRESLNKANEAMRDAADEYESAKSGLQSISSKLEEQGRKMDELLAKDKLTYAEKGQLEELQAITRELMIQQDIAERNAERAAKEAADKAVDAYEKQYGSYDISRETLDDKFRAVRETGFFPVSDGANDITGNIAAYVRATELLEEARAGYDKALRNGEDTTLFEDDIQYYTDMVDDYTDALDSSISDLQEKRAALEDEYNRAAEKRESGLEPLTSSEKDVIATYESIYSAMKLVYEYTDQNAWNNMEVSSIFNTEGIEKTKEELIAMAKAGELSPETISGYEKLNDAIQNSEIFLKDGQTAAEAFCDEIYGCVDAAEALDKAAEVKSPTLSISDTVSQLNTQLKPAFDSLKSAYNDIFTDDGEFALNSIDILSTCDSIKSKLDDMAELGLSVDYSSYEDFVRVLSNTESESGDVETAFDSLATSITQAALKGTEDFETMKAALEDLGVVNNEIVAFDALISNTEALKEAGLDLADATDEQIQAFADAMVSAENYGQAVNLLRIQKLLCAEEPLNTENDIQNLYSLAQAAGIATNAIQQLMGLNSAYEMASENGNTIAMTAVKVQMDMVRKQVVDQFSRLKTDVDFSDIGGGASKAAKAGSAAGKSYADALKDELSNLNSVISYIGDTIDKQIDLFEDQKDAAVEALEAEKEAAEEALEAEKELVQEKIDGKQAEIDAIKDATIARKNELDLQKALYDQERMQNQKTILQYSEEKGMHYVIDTKEARDAKEKVTEAKENIQIADLEKEISGLNDIIDDLDKKIEESNEYYDKLIEETEKYWDSLIKGLEEYKSRWEELADIEEQAKMEAALRRLGITTEDVLNMSESAFESFKGTYLGLLNQMYSGNDDMIDMLQKFGGISTDALKPLSGTIGDVADSLDRYTGSTDNAGMSTSTASESVSNLNTNAAGLNENLSGISDHLDSILEDNKLETVAEQVGGVAESVQSLSDALNDIPADLDMGNTIAQFDALGNSVDKVTASISGGTVSKAESGEPTGKNAPNAQNSSSNGANSLAGSIREVKSETDRSIGTGEGSGAIGQFNQLGESVTDVTAAVGGSENRNNNGDGDSGNLISSINDLGKTTAETLGEPDGEGAIGKFETFGDTIAEAEGHTQGIIDKMNKLDGMTAECTITVNVETNGSIPTFAEGTINTDFESGEFTPRYGRAFAEGTGKYQGLPKAEKNALVSEYGQTEMTVLPNGDTIITDEPTLMDLPKDTVIYNEEQTKKIMDNKVDASGKAYADGTVGTTITSGENINTPYNPDLDDSYFAKLYRAWNKYYGNIDNNVEEIQKTLTQHVAMEHNQQMHEEVNRFINNSSNVVNNRNIQQPITFGDIHVTCPGVTEQQVARYVPGAVKAELTKEFNGLHNLADQWIRR